MDGRPARRGRPDEPAGDRGPGVRRPWYWR